MPKLTESPKPKLTRLGWTADFKEFRKKVESVFGPLETMAKDAPDVYAHMVLSHGFMEYVGVSRLSDVARAVVMTKYGIEKYDSTNPEQSKGYWTYLKREYKRWIVQNKLPKRLAEIGWREFVED